MYKKILVPLDGSEFAEVVLPHVEDIARRMEAEVVLMRVVHYVADYLAAANVMTATNPMVLESIKEGDDAIRQEAGKYLVGIASLLRDKGLKVKTDVLFGPVAESILDAADEEKADLIAMSTHGRSGVARWLVGSVADRIVHGAKVPVLLVRPVTHIVQAQ